MPQLRLARLGPARPRGSASEIFRLWLRFRLKRLPARSNGLSLTPARTFSQTEPDLRSIYWIYSDYFSWSTTAFFTEFNNQIYCLMTRMKLFWITHSAHALCKSISWCVNNLSFIRWWSWQRFFQLWISHPEIKTTHQPPKRGRGGSQSGWKKCQIAHIKITHFIPQKGRGRERFFPMYTALLQHRHHHHPTHSSPTHQSNIICYEFSHLFFLIPLVFGFFHFPLESVWVSGTVERGWGWHEAQPTHSLDLI